jgi:hypothetical protein
MWHRIFGNSALLGAQNSQVPDLGGYLYLFGSRSESGGKLYIELTIGGAEFRAQQLLPKVAEYQGSLCRRVSNFEHPY